MNRGYSVIGLHRPKNSLNIGSVLRAAGCYDADLVVLGEDRTYFTKGVTDTQKSWKHIPTISVENVLSVLPLGAEAVAVDLVENASCLFNFVHPERAFYVFGPEDGTLPEELVKKCRYRVMIPTSFCMNLAATVNVVLYDRAAKLDRRLNPNTNKRARL